MTESVVNMLMHQWRNGEVEKILGSPVQRGERRWEESKNQVGRQLWTEKMVGAV